MAVAPHRWAVCRRSARHTAAADLRAKGTTVSDLTARSAAPDSKDIIAASPPLEVGMDLGALRGTADPLVISIGHARDPAVSYLGTALAPLWKSYWPSWEQMVAFFSRRLLSRCPALRGTRPVIGGVFALLTLAKGSPGP